MTPIVLVLGFKLKLGADLKLCVAGYLLSNRRTNLTDSNFDKLLFGHVNFDLCDHVSRKRKALDD